MLRLEWVKCEPEQFPCLVFRLDEPKVVLLLFSSGKLVCTGTKKEPDIETAISRITEIPMMAGLLPK